MEAAPRAERSAHQRETRWLRSHRLELERCRYEAGLAERRYPAEDPDNRLVMPSPAHDWEASLEAVAGRIGGDPRSRRGRGPCCASFGFLRRFCVKQK